MTSDTLKPKGSLIKTPKTEVQSVMEQLTAIAKDQDTIFLSTTMTGNIQLIRLEHIGCFRYSAKSKQWEAVLCDKHVLMLKRKTNSQMILNYHPHLIQINQSCIINRSYLVYIKDRYCSLLPPFDEIEDLQISKPFMNKLKELFVNI